MPTNKNAQLRYQILDRCFRNTRRKYEIEDLMDEVNETLNDVNGKGVGIRQIREDIKYMRDSATFNAPIEAVPYDGKKCYYRYSDINFSIFNNELSDEELENLRSTIEMLGHYRGIPANAWLEEVISNLEYHFGVKPNNENLVSFEQNENLKGLEFLSDVIDATVRHQPLNIIYQSYKGNTLEFILHPYYVKSYNGRWFVFGLQEGEKRIMNLALDRIESLSESDTPFIKNKLVDFDSYFKDIVGVTVPSDDVKVESIVLRFSQHRFPYVVSKPIHQTQSILNEEDCTIVIHVKPNFELNQQIFSFLPDVEVVSPQWFREEIIGKIQENLKKYFAVQKECTTDSYLCNVITKDDKHKNV